MVLRHGRRTNNNRISVIFLSFKGLIIIAPTRKRFTCF
jgi:hypothetical protein